MRRLLPSHSSTSPTISQVDQHEDDGGKQDGAERRPLVEAKREEFVVDMALIGKKRIPALAEAVEIDTHHVEGRDDERRERKHYLIVVFGHFRRVDVGDAEGDE